MKNKFYKSVKVLLVSIILNVAPVFFSTLHANESLQHQYIFNHFIARANIKYAQGDKKEAERLLYAALKMTPYGSAQLLRVAEGFNTIGEPENAIPVYEEYLQQHPNDIEATLLLAKTLQDAHRYGEAENYYQQVLATDPNNTSARWQLAVLHDYTNRSRLATRGLAPLVAADPGNAYLMQDYAHAQYWAGYDREAFFSASVSPSAEMADLSRYITRDLSNSATLGVGYLTDSDGLHLTQAYLWGLYYFDPTLVLTPTVIYGSYRQDGEVIDAEQVTFELTKRYGDINSEYGLAWPSILLGVRNFGGWVTPAWAIGTEWYPVDQWNFQIYAENQVVDASVQAIENHILYSYAAVAAHHGFTNPRFAVNVEAGVGYFTEDNIRTEIANDWAAILVFDPEITLDLWAYYFNDSNPDPDLGYYNPENYLEIGAALEYNKEIGSYIFDVYGGLGRYREMPGSSGPLGIGQIGLTKDFDRYGLLNASFLYSNSAATGGQGGANYIQYLGDINYTIYF